MKTISILFAFYHPSLTPPPPPPPSPSPSPPSPPPPRPLPIGWLTIR